MHKVSRVILLLITTIFFACSGDDSGEQDIVDTRVKFVFDYQGDITFVGDQTNKVLKRFYVPSGLQSFRGYHFNEQTNTIKIIAQGPEFYDYQIVSFNVHELYHSSDGNTSYTVNNTPINLDGEEQIVLAMFHSETKFLLLTKIYPDENYRIRTFENDVLVNTESIYDLMPFHAFFASASYVTNVKELLNVYQNNSGTFLQRYNTETWTQSGTTVNFPRAIFNSFGYENEAFLITRSEFNEQLHSIDGTVLGTIDDQYSYLGGACIGYDTVDQQYEYLHRSDGRNEAGVINTSNGTIERRGLEGEPGFIDSPLFFFNL